MGKPRDSQRQRIFNAESTIDVGPRRILTEPEARDLVRRVSRSKWWANHSTDNPFDIWAGIDAAPVRRQGYAGPSIGPPPIITPTIRLSTTLSSCYPHTELTDTGVVSTIHCQGLTLTQTDILHRICHILIPELPTSAEYPKGVALHGREFATLELSCVSRFMGVEAKKQLRKAFKDANVRCTVGWSPEARQAASLRMKGKALLALRNEMS